MDFIRAGEALWRSSQPLLLPFLAPTAYRASPMSTTPRHCRPQRLQQSTILPSTRSPFSTSCLHRQQATATAQKEDTGDTSTQPSTDDDIFNFDEILKPALDASNATQSNSRSRNTPKQPSNGPQTTFGDQSADSLSSVDDFIFSTTSPNRRSNANNPFSIDDAFNPTPRPPPAPQPSPIKLGPSVGRTIQVNSLRGVDVGRAFRMLDIRCRQNSVRSDFMRQRFHERPGLKRKRLKSERWRRRFKEAFQGTVGMVKRMKKQGW